MASETLEEKKPEDGGSVEEKGEVEDKEDKGEVKEENEKGELSEKEEVDAEMSEKKEEMSEKDDSPENEMLEEKGEESKEEGEGSKKGKRSRKESSKKVTEKQLGQESTDKKVSVKEPVTPNERPTRERKTVERYSEPSAGRASASKGLSIEKGSGTQLKDIPNVAFKLSKRKPDDNLQTLHTILFGKKAKAHSLKKNIGQFSGYVWVENEKEKQRAKVKEKLDKCVKEKLMDFCDVLNIPVNKAKKEELSAKLLEFLESPHTTTDVLLADKEQKGKKRKRKIAPNKNTSSGEASIETAAKKRKQTPEVLEKGKHSSKVEEEDDVDDKVEPSDVKDDSNEDDNDTKEESDPEQSEEDEPKKQMSSKKSSSKKNLREDSVAKPKATPVKKGTPAKSTKKPSSSKVKKGAADADGTSGSLSKSKGSASKKQKVEKEKQDRSVLAKEKATGKKESSKSPAKVSAKDQGKGKTSKKAKAEPSREEMHRIVVDILKEVDFNTATLSDILRQLGTHFGVDLMHRKAEVKDIITDVINNMTDEEDEGEEGEGDDADKDGDSDDA